jgi:hypothetical protein
MFDASPSGMKALPKKLLPLILFGIAVTSLFSVRPAQGYIVTLAQVGSNVVATGSGPINLTGLTFAQSGQVTGGAFIGPSNALIQTGPTGLVNFDLYGGLFTGPTSFGSGLGTFADTGSGDFVGIHILNVLDGNVPNGLLVVPQGYVSGAALSDSMTFNNATFASLGVTPGTYVWTWGTGANQNFTLVIGGAGVPDGGSTVSLLGCALFGVAALRRKLKLLRRVS